MSGDTCRTNNNAVLHVQSGVVVIVLSLKYVV